MVSGTLAPPEPAETPSAKEGRLTVNAANAALIAVITLAAAVLRIHAITAKSFWGDEAYSVEIARLPWPDFFHILWFREANMSLYYLLLRFWLHLGSGEAWIRGLSVLVSVATVPLMVALGRRLFGRGAGLLAAWLLAINAYDIRYAQEARSYALVVFLCVLATWLLVRNIQEPASARWGAYAAVCVLVVYSHFFGALVVVAHGVALLFLPRGEVPWRALLRKMLWFVYLMIPVEFFVMTTGAGPVGWIPPTNAKAVWDFFAAMAGNYGAPLLILFAMALGFAAWTGWNEWRRSGRSIQSWAFVLAFIWLLLPVLVVLAVSMSRPFFVARYLIPCLPALILIVAAGIARLRPAILAGALCAAISVFAVFGAASYYRRDFDVDRRDWRGASSFVFDHARPGDGVFFYGGSGHVLFEFYRQVRRPAPPWPQVLESEKPTGITFRDFVYRDLDTVLAESRPAGGRVWLVMADDMGPDGKPNESSVRLRELYGRERRLVETTSFSDITILLYARDAANASGRNSLTKESKREEIGSVSWRKGVANLNRITP